MSRLSQIRSKDLVKFFLKQGFGISRQTGSHLRLNHSDGRGITVAMHNQPVSLGTLHSILRQAGMNRDQFLKVFKK